MKNQNAKQQGFAIAGMLILLPVLLVMLASIFLIKSILVPEEETLQICRAELLKIQSSAEAKISELLKLNTRVLQLKLELQEAKASLEIAVATESPPAIALAEANLHRVQLQQQSLRLRQLALITATEQTVSIGSSHTFGRIRAALANYEARFKYFFSLTSSVQAPSTYNLALDSELDADGGPPTYKLPVDFPDRQKVSLNWKFVLTKENAGGLPWSKAAYQKKDSCAATLVLAPPRGLAPMLAEARF